MFGLRISLVSVLTIGITTYLALKMWNHYDHSTFAYHPALLTAAFAGGFPLAIHSKTIGSKSVVHGVLSSIAAAAAAYGMYVIYVLKEDGGRTHFYSVLDPSVSWHAVIGALAVAGVVFQATVPWIKGYAPMARSDANIHRTGGKIHIVLGAVALLTGWWKPYGGDGASFALVVGGLAVILVSVFTRVSQPLADTIVAKL